MNTATNVPTCPTCGGLATHQVSSGQLFCSNAHYWWPTPLVPSEAGGRAELDNAVRAIAAAAFQAWDRDEDSRVGKLLRALAGETGIRPDLDAIRARLASRPVSGEDGLREAVDDAILVFDWLDRLGGLGHEKHAEIARIVARLRAARAAEGSDNA